VSANYIPHDECNDPSEEGASHRGYTWNLFEIDATLSSSAVTTMFIDNPDPANTSLPSLYSGTASFSGWAVSDTAEITDGTHQLQVTATSASGYQQESASVPFNVSN